MSIRWGTSVVGIVQNILSVQCRSLERITVMAKILQKSADANLSKFCMIQIIHDSNFSRAKSLFFYNFIYQRSIVMGCACLDMIRIFFLFFWGEITTVHKWQLGRKAKNSLRPEEQYHTNWWSVRRFKENFGLDWVQWAILKIYV